jgi:TPR repeat protein
LGQALQNADRAVLAVNDYERGCVARNYESCIQLAFLATAKTVDSSTAVLKPWCALGVERACWALRAPAWRQQLKKENLECAKSREACDREADLLLVGPRRPAELERARTALDRRCREGSPVVCARAGVEWRSELKVKEAIDAFERACKGGVPQACVELAGLTAVGVGAPRNVEGAARTLKIECDRGNADACSVIGRPRP